MKCFICKKEIKKKTILAQGKYPITHINKYFCSIKCQLKCRGTKYWEFIKWKENLTANKDSNL